MDHPAGLVVLSLPFLLVLALAWQWPTFNKTWSQSVLSHAFSWVAAIGLGWFGALTAGFGMAVGDPPYGTGEAKFDFMVIWSSVTLYVIAGLYILRASLWLMVRTFAVVKGTS
jgi:hypothetical protein